METVSQHQKVMRGRMYRSGHGFRVGKLQESRAALCCGVEGWSPLLRLESSHAVFGENHFTRLRKRDASNRASQPPRSKLYLQSLHSIQVQPSTSTFYTITSSGHSFYRNCIFSPCRPRRNDGSCHRTQTTHRPFQASHEVSMLLPRFRKETAPQRQLSRRMIMWTSSQLPILRATGRERRRTPRKTARPSQHFFLQS